MAIKFNGTRIKNISGGGGGPTSGNITSFATTSGDSYTELLVHFDGSDGSASFTDDSASPLSIAVSSGTVQVKNTQSKFGGTSGYFNGVNTNVLRISNVTNKINFGTGSFTIEGWFYLNSNNIGYQPLLCFGSTADGQGPILYLESNNTLSFVASTSGSGWTYAVGSATIPTTGTWHHIAIVGTSGQHLKLYYNGTNISTVNQAYTLHTSNNLYFGHYPFFPGGARTFNGYIDEVRISSTDRYSSNFTSPTTAFETGVLTYPSAELGKVVKDNSGNLYRCTDAVIPVWNKYVLG